MYKTIREATEAWVGEFSRVQTDMISRLMYHEPERWREVTKPTVGDRVYAYTPPRGISENYGEITEVDEDEDLYTICLDSGESFCTGRDDFELDNDSYLPIWGYMWQFKDSADEWWIESCGGIQTLSECGFRVYESDDFGYFFGIDAAGYDFYDAFWIPLYLARGLQWADEQHEKEDA